MPHKTPASKLASQDPANPSTFTIGIDVSKDHLDAALHPEGGTKRFANTGPGITALRRWIGRRDVGRVVFEATGFYHREMERRLTQAGFALAKINPRQARRFAEATGKLAKTDRVDAIMLARFGALLEPKQQQPRSETRLALQELVAARRSLMADRTALLNRQKTLTLALLKRQATARLRQVETQVDALDAEIAALVRTDPELVRQCAILTSIPGLGTVTAHALLADMPELGTMDEKQAAALAGLAPITRQSGKWSGKSFIQGGRATIRQALYMPALVAMRFNPDLARIYQALIQRGKHAKLAITAVMRRMIVLANTLIQNDRLWTAKRA